MNKILQKSRTTKVKPSCDGPYFKPLCLGSLGSGTFDKKTKTSGKKPCGGGKNMRPGYGKTVQGIEDIEGYLGTEDLRPEDELISDPICFTGHAFEQHINWDEEEDEG